MNQVTVVRRGLIQGFRCVVSGREWIESPELSRDAAELQANDFAHKLAVSMDAEYETRMTPEQRREVYADYLKRKAKREAMAEKIFPAQLVE